MGVVIDIDSARKRRTASRFCTNCKQPWGLRGIHRDGEFIIRCLHCGFVRARVPNLHPSVPPEVHDG